jgi:hypothetical protein
MLARVQGHCERQRRRRRVIFTFGAFGFALGLAFGVAVGIVEVGVVLLESVVGHGWRVGGEGEGLRKGGEEENNKRTKNKRFEIIRPVGSRGRNRDTNGALLGSRRAGRVLVLV